jgi:Nif-specific regulatory protein
VGNSREMVEIYKMIDTVARANTTVLIRGESGVGKEGIAHAIHYHSPRADGPFIKLNCSALPESLIESELFGHEKGAFTGASNKRIGRFELAHGGTLFLDELGDLPLSTQVKLLRVLQERTIERLGGTETISVDVRIVCATNRDLEDQIKEGEFREDLFFRINVFPIYIPPLRERKSDIPGLVDHFIGKINKRDNLKIKRICSSAMDMLMQYHWPGNVRELENVVERSCLLSRNGVIYGYHLPPSLQVPVKSHINQGPLDTVLSKLEKELLLDALKYTRGNMAKAAEILGISERMMGIRIKKYNIDARKFKTTHGYQEVGKG